jgi:hypothetical protein
MKGMDGKHLTNALKKCLRKLVWSFSSYTKYFWEKKIDLSSLYDEDKFDYK